MKKPVARPTKIKPEPKTEQRQPRAYAPPTEAEPIKSFTEQPADLPLAAPTKKRRHWLRNTLIATAGVLVSLSLALATESLIRALFARYEWLGWVAFGAASLLVLALIVLAANEIRALSRLKKLDHLRDLAAKTIADDNPDQGRRLLAQLQALYASHPEMARPRKQLDETTAQMLDGADMVHAAERSLMAPIDARAKALTAAAARRVAVVTAISPRALIDVAYVAYESIKLARAIASLYGARPGVLGSWRMFGAILGHLAVTGGVALGDSVIQQMLGHGLAAKLSARLGEGLVNGLMTVRVGIAAMRVTRPLPFDALKQPAVMDFAGDLARLNAPKDEG